MKGAIAAMLLVVLAGCDRGDAMQDAELAAELRAMRAALANNAAPAVDPAVMTQTFAPLREAVQTLLTEQAVLAQRQLALTQELQRWTQVVATGTTATHADEVQALRVRLGELEAALQTQEAQRAQVEKVVQSALDRTADQLGALLQLLQTRQAPPPAEPQTTPSPDKTQAPPPAGASEPNGAVPPARDATSDPTIVWLTLLAFTGVAMLWLLWRQPRRRRRVMVAEEAPGLDRGVEEIWAAAELLGEAVGRLRQSKEGDADEAAAALHAFAVPQELQAAQPELNKQPQPVPPEPLPASRRPPPPTALFVVPLRGSSQANAVAALQQLLAVDPRVLRRPAPEIVAADGRAAVRCCLLPALGVGEQAHLEQCLRDAVA